MKSNGLKCNSRFVLLGSLFLIGFVNLIFVSLKDLRLYYEPSDDNSYNLDSSSFYYSQDRSQLKSDDGDGEQGEEDNAISIHVQPLEGVHQENPLISSVSTDNNDDSKKDGAATDSTTEETFDEATYKIQLSKSLEPIPNQATGAYLHVFWSGFCNQYYMFSGMLLLAKESNYSQIIVQSIRWKDLFGTNQLIRHDFFFDIVHWNTYYPKLPKLISYDETTHTELDIPNPNDDKPHIKWKIDDPYANATNPYAIGEKRTSAIMKFYDYTKGIEKGRSGRDESELLMMRSALRPHPAIRDIMTSFKRENQIKNSMVIHARIEPDMQKHPMCKEHKVLNITDIVNMLYEKFPEPPVETVLIILNREILEKEVANQKDVNEMAVHNLKNINEIIADGLWDGRVKVLEAGSGLAKASNSLMYAKYSSLVGSIMNFFLSLEADIFIGTIVSSYSTSVISFRFFRENKQNYFYLPKGLDLVTKPGTKEPPRFAC